MNKRQSKTENIQNENIQNEIIQNEIIQNENIQTENIKLNKVQRKKRETYIIIYIRPLHNLHGSSIVLGRKIHTRRPIYAQGHGGRLPGRGGDEGVSSGRLHHSAHEH